MSTWTEAMLKRASDMWRKGQSAGAIAQEMQVTRNAVIGVVNRNRDLFAARRGAATVAPVAVSRVNQKKPVKTVANAPVRIGRPPKPPAPPTEKSIFENLLDGAASKRDLDRFQIPDQASIPFVDLAQGQCKFMLVAFDAVAGPQTPCCGAETPDLSPWCAQHRLIVFKARAA